MHAEFLAKFSGTINDKRVKKAGARGSALTKGNEEAAAMFKIVENCASYRKMPEA